MRSDTVAYLAARGFTPEDVERAGMFDTEDARTVHEDFKALPCLVIPYYDARHEIVSFTRDGGTYNFCRVRYMDPPAAPSGFKIAKTQRYAQPSKSGTRAYFPPIMDWDRIAANPEEPIIITEGELKALAGCKANLPVIALGGVFNFMDTPTGILPELEEWAWKGRDVYIVFDTDAATNPNILLAEARLVEQLQTKRGASCYLVRIPLAGEHKVGLDDFLLAHGADALRSLILSAPSLSSLDAQIVGMNKEVAWIEREGMVYVIPDRLFLKKDNFVKGSRFSSLTHLSAGSKQRTAPKPVRVSDVWLTHPHAQRYGEILFRPGEGTTVTSDTGRPALNMWNEPAGEPGDVTPFLKLTEFLFRNVPTQEGRALPIKLMAYKAQNPQKKVPLCIVLIGKQGCGKTLWGETVRDAFGLYGTDVSPKSLASQYQGWMENTLIALCNEAEGEDITAAGEMFKALISDQTRQMEEKYRPSRRILTYTQYIITSNRRAVGAYAADDRRMIVVDCPPKEEMPDPGLYKLLGRKSGEWYHAGGPRWLYHYLKTLDLKGWEPPDSPPMTPEKWLSFNESLTPVQQLAADMLEAEAPMMRQWLTGSVKWAQQNLDNPQRQIAEAANATLQNAGEMEIRDWYTPTELALIFPAIITRATGTKWNPMTPAGQMSRELREAGIPYLTCADSPKGFRWKGQFRQYLVVSNFNEWKVPIRQADFERYMASWPKFGTASAQRRAS